LDSLTSLLGIDLKQLDNVQTFPHNDSVECVLKIIVTWGKINDGFRYVNRASATSSTDDAEFWVRASHTHFTIQPQYMEV